MAIDIQDITANIQNLQRQLQAEKDKFPAEMLDEMDHEYFENAFSALQLLSERMKMKKGC